MTAPNITQEPIPNTQVPPLESQLPSGEPVPPTNPSALETVFAQSAREALQEAARLRAELARRDSIQQAAVQTPQNFWENPVEVQRNIAKEEITAALAPFVQDFSVMRRSQQYQALKAQAKAQVNNFALVENLVDVAMSNIEPTVQNMQAAISYAFGQLYLNGSLVPNTPAPIPAPKVNPPYIAPTPPPAPANIPNVNDVPLTEMDRRVMREAGFKDEAEFKLWRDAPFNALKPEGV